MLLPFEPGEIFPVSDPLVGIRAEETGPEIAAALELPPDPTVIREVEQFIRRFVILSKAACLPAALWAVATHLADVFDAFPYTAITSPTKGCGKTRVLELYALLYAKPVWITSPSLAALFRMMAGSPTLLWDEVEALKAKQVSDVCQAILGILHVGYKKGATVPRCEPPKWEVSHHPVYGPKAFTAIGTLPSTLSDRCICINMQRKKKTQHVDRFSERKTPREAKPIRALVEQWMQAQRDTVRAAYDEMPELDFLRDRDEEVWTPLFALCAVAAPERVSELERDCFRRPIRKRRPRGGGVWRC